MNTENLATVEIARGADTSVQLTYSDDFRKPVLLTGYSAFCTVKSPDLITTHDTLSTVNGRITLTQSTGGISLDFPSSVTAAYTFTSAVFDVLLVSPAGKHTYLPLMQITTYQPSTVPP